jgi:hypothetical protein
MQRDERGEWIDLGDNLDPLAGDQADDEERDDGRGEQADEGKGSALTIALAVGLGVLAAGTCGGLAVLYVLRLLKGIVGPML